MTVLEQWMKFGKINLREWKNPFIKEQDIFYPTLNLVLDSSVELFSIPGYLWKVFISVC